MGNQALIKGAALAAPKFNDIGAAAVKGASAIGNFYIAKAAEKRQEERAQKAKVETYLNAMPSGIELSKIPPAQQEGVAAWSKQMKFEYAEAARVLPSLDPGSEEYIEAMSKMTNVKQAFSNLNNNLETFKANKTEYLKSSSSGSLSKGNDSKQGNLLASIYTDESDMIFDENGNMAFKSEDSVLNLNDVPDYFNKDFKSADTLININSDIYNSGQKLDPTMNNMYRQKILNMIRQGGRETTLSLATDDLIQEGGLGIMDQDLLNNPERQEELEQTVVDNYMNILNSSANSGYKKKSDAAAAAAAAKNKNKGNNGFNYGQRINADLEIYQQKSLDTYSSITSQLPTLNDPQSKVDFINKTLKQGNSEALEVKVDKDGIYIEFENERGRIQKLDPGFDLNNPVSMVDFILDNVGGDLDADAREIVRQRMTKQSKSGGL
jgi:hypothetical protein